MAEESEKLMDERIAVHRSSGPPNGYAIALMWAARRLFAGKAPYVKEAELS